MQDLNCNRFLRRDLPECWHSTTDVIIDQESQSTLASNPCVRTGFKGSKNEKNRGFYEQTAQWKVRPAEGICFAAAVLSKPPQSPVWL